MWGLGDIPHHQHLDNKVQEGEIFPFTPTFSSLSPFSACPTPATVVIMILIAIDTRHPPLCVAFSARLLDQRQGPRLISIWTSEEI